MARQLSVKTNTWPLAGVFRISRGARTEAHVVVATISDGEVSGQGECVPYPRYGESVESVMAQIRSAASAIADGCSREELLTVLPAGAARNAVDCALLDFEAKASGSPAWQIVGLESAPGPLTTAYSLSVDAPEAMGKAAAEHAARPLLKIKLSGDGDDVARLDAIRDAAPTTRLIVDANEGWSPEAYAEIVDDLSRLRVEMIEQPMPASDDEALRGMDRPVPLCADESCHDTSTLQALVGKYDLINIKLDKTGGITEAMRLKKQAEALGFKIMVGCMIGSSLAMAPAVLVAQGAQVVDLDAPLLLAEDQQPALTYDGSIVYPATPELWG